MSRQLPFAALGQPRMLVLGDLILDRYTWGAAERVSPEAPVLVLEAECSEIRPGGAASVAFLLRGLEAEVSLAGVVGNDHDGATLRRTLSEAGIDPDFVWTDPDRMTTTKERFLGRAEGRPPHQILRVDHESRRPLPARLEQQMAAAIRERVSDFQAVLIADYAKGCCTPALLQQVISAAKEAGIPVLVDPGRGRAVNLYRGATLLKPNRREAEALTGFSIVAPDDAVRAARNLCEVGALDAAVVTLDRAGMVYAVKDGDTGQSPVKPRSVCDITGAGDMALAAFGLAATANWPLADAVELANLAAGLEVERLGIEPVTLQELRQAAIFGIRKQSDKVCAMGDLVRIVAEHRRQGKTIVLTNGCFDLLHAGHLQCLQEARSYGDVLIVAINSDESVRRLKGPRRPILPQQERASLLAGLACVDHVVIFEDATPHRLLAQLQPDILVKGGTTAAVVGREVVEAYGGKIVTTSRVRDRSTTQIVQSVEGVSSLSVP